VWVCESIVIGMLHFRYITCLLGCLVPRNVFTATIIRNKFFLETYRQELPPIPASELPFKCHLCEASYGERSEALDHIRNQHPAEFHILMSKGALDTASEEDRVPHEEHDEVMEHSRGKFPDYAHRKVIIII